MAKKGAKQKNVVPIQSVVKSNEIDYDKLADAIVRANHTIEAEKRERAEKEIEEWRKTIGVRDYPHRPIRQALNNTASVFRMMFIKRDKATTSKATYSLIRVYAEWSFSAVKWLLYIISAILVLYGVNTAIHSDWMRMATHLVYALLTFVMARLFRIAGFEVSNMRDRSEVLAISSTIAAIAALMVAIAALVVEVLIK
ncbi:MAG: hypothetical protein IKO68_03720 [Oscillospiraceae bacterium]|nr:hypothetical protein [Oscillospiraceae bacterium]